MRFLLSAGISLLLRHISLWREIPAGHAPFQVDRVRHWLQMRWVHTTADKAEMVQFKSIGKRANQPLIGEAVCESGSVDLFADPESAIATRYGTVPNPTGAEVGAIRGNGPVLVHLLPETPDQGRVGGRSPCQRVAMSSHTEKMAIAECPGLNDAVATGDLTPQVDVLPTPATVVHRAHGSAEDRLLAIGDGTMWGHREESFPGARRQAVTSGTAAFIIPETGQ